MTGSAVAARHAVAREPAASVGFLPGMSWRTTVEVSPDDTAGRVAGVAMRAAAGALTVAVLVVGGCAARVPVVTNPAFPDFLFPTVPPAFAASAVDGEQRDAWAFLQAGDLDQAERRFAALLARDAAFFPATVGLGWVEFARGSYREAVEHFDEALDGAAGYVPALVGRGDALLAADFVGDALESFEAAFAADPALARVGRLVGELRLRVMTERLDAARAAVDEGRLADAETVYADMIAASPYSAFLHLELAAILRRQGKLDEALDRVRRARGLEPDQTEAVVVEAALLEQLGDLEAAEAAYALAEALNPTDESAAGLARVQRALQFARLPSEYRDLSVAESATRGDLAALLGVQLAELLGDAAFGEVTPILTDTRDHWASRWIVETVRAGVMAAGAGNRFEPERPLRRGELADVVAGVLELVADLDPEAAGRWRAVAVSFADMNPGHLNYESATLAVGAGVLGTLGDDRFDPTGSVSGSDAVGAVEQLVRLADRAE